MYKNSYTTGATYGAGAAYLFGVPELILICSEVRLVRPYVSCVVFCWSLFVLLWVLCGQIVLSVLRFTAFDYSVGIFKLFAKHWWFMATIVWIIAQIYDLVHATCTWNIHHQVRSKSKDWTNTYDKSMCEQVNKNT